LGLPLGLGYLTKTFLFPMAFVFLVLAFLTGENRRAAAWRSLVALLIFLLVAGPYVAALSRAKGHWTVGETGRLNYAWHVNGVPTHHWQGGPEGNGKPHHPARKIFDEIPVYEFAPAVWGTYPDWFDPSYGFEGLILRFDLGRQVQVFIAGLRLCGLLGLRYLMPLAALFPLLILIGLRSRWLSRLAAQSLLLIPALVAALLYSLVHVEARYVAPFLVVFWLGIIGTIALPSSIGSKRVLAGSTVVVLILMGLKIAAAIPQSVSYRDQYLQEGSLHVASDLKRMGIRPGDRVVYFGQTVAVWARLAHVRIVADAFFEESMDETRFWSLDSKAQTALMRSLKATGARAVVFQSYLSATPPPGWSRIGVPERTPSYFVCFLESGCAVPSGLDRLNR
jgi:hypothetical protein